MDKHTEKYKWIKVTGQKWKIRVLSFLLGAIIITSVLLFIRQLTYFFMLDTIVSRDALLTVWLSLVLISLAWAIFAIKCPDCKSLIWWHLYSIKNGIKEIKNLKSCPVCQAKKDAEKDKDHLENKDQVSKRDHEKKKILNILLTIVGALVAISAVLHLKNISSEKKAIASFCRKATQKSNLDDLEAEAREKGYNVARCSDRLIVEEMIGKGFPFLKRCSSCTIRFFPKSKSILHGNFDLIGINKVHPCVGLPECHHDPKIKRQF